MNIKIKLGGYQYTFSKEKNELDTLLLKFTDSIQKIGIKYVVVSGYVAILFGRSRLSEDIDILVGKADYGKFLKLWNLLMDDFWCIITGNPEEAYQIYLNSYLPLRFALKNHIIPNIEIKFPKTELERWVIEDTVQVQIDNKFINISNMEMQIAFKLYLGSEKDIEDAKYLYELFKESLQYEIFEKLIRMLNVEDAARRYLGWKFPR